MEWTYFLPLFLSACSLAVFWLIYHFALKQLTHFNWQRWYLLSAICFSIALPFLPTFSNWLPTALTIDNSSTAGIVNTWNFNPVSPSIAQIEQATNISTEVSYSAILLMALVVIYLSGVILKALFFVEKLSTVRQLILSNPKEKEGSEWLVQIPEEGTAFSFFNYIFLTKSLAELTEQEVAQIKRHEQIHSQQKHSFDIILVEIAEIFFWFHPAIYSVKSSLKDIHEYLVDTAMTQQSISKKNYAHLMLKLSIPLTINSLTTGFTNKQIGRRIRMLAIKPSASYHKLKFLLMIPIIASLLLFTACFGDTNQITPLADPPQKIELTEKESNVTSLKIGEISWEGNTIYTEKELNDALRLKEGDAFDKALLDQRLHWDGKGTDVSSLYMNNGYTYFSVEMEETKRGNTIDLNFKLFEGVEVSIANISISGNTTVNSTELLDKLDIKKGDVFSRSKIINAQKALVAMGKFDPEQIGINTPILPDNNQLMNIEFSLVELK